MSGFIGINEYHISSNISAAATHMGLVDSSEGSKELYIKIVECSGDFYKGATRNGITSLEKVDNSNGYAFVKQNDQGEWIEIKNPTITDVKTTYSGDTATVEVSAEGYNGATISKYYYSTDDGLTYVEGGNTYSFGTETLKIYVEDSNGKSSEIKDIIAKKSGKAKFENGSISPWKSYAGNNTSAITETTHNYILVDCRNYEANAQITINISTRTIFTVAGQVSTRRARIVASYLKISQDSSSWTTFLTNEITGYKKQDNVVKKETTFSGGEVYLLDVSAYAYVPAHCSMQLYINSVDITINGEPIKEPEVLFNLPDDYIDVDGEKWYPYDTKLEIYYVGVVNGKNYYAARNEFTNKLSDYTYVKEPWHKADISLHESSTYFAKIDNSPFASKVESVSQKINIMPNAEGMNANQSNYYSNASVGNIYPVQVTGTKDGTIYGTNTYQYSSNINKAATHMGLVNLDETKTLYIKIVKTPTDGYVGRTLCNEITSTELQGNSENGYIFVDKDGNPLKPQITDNSYNWNGYDVHYNGEYYFEKEETSIVSNNVGIDNTTASSYIELDFTKYNETDLLAITFNAEISSEYADYGSVYLSESPTIPQSNTTVGRIINISGENVEAKDYAKVVSGGKKYYLIFVYRKDGSTSVGDDKMKINSLEIKEVNQMESGGISLKFEDSTQEPVRYNDELWYPYNAKLKIEMNGYTVDKLYYKYVYEDNSVSSINTYITATDTITLNRNCTIYCGYTEECKEFSQKINIMPNSSGISSDQSEYYQNIGGIYPVRVTGASSGSNLYGNNIYLHSSNINNAATHMGIVEVGETKDVLIKIVQNPAGGFIRATKNNITSTDSGSIDAGYVFVTSDGKELLEPKINNLDINLDNDNKSITANITANGENGATIKQYYYRIDGGEWIEYNTNTYEFTEIDTNKTHTISVYVRDSNKATSQVSELVNDVIAQGAKPTITLNQEPIIDKDGNEWYPYRSKVTINFFPSGTSNLKGYYKSTDERTAIQSNWNTIGSGGVYDNTLSYSTTYIAKTKNDTTKEETEEIRKTINIMPDTTSGPTEYYQYIGTVLPVQVIWSNAGYAYGTDTYHYNSNINKAASHMGLVKEGDEPKLLYIKIVEIPKGGYIGTTRYGITTNDYPGTSTTITGFVFVDENGNEIKMPTIASVSTTSGEDSINVTVNLDEFDSPIEKYYYKVDNGEYIESTSNVQTLNITTSGKRTIKVYAQSSNGKRTPEKEVYGNRNIPIPKLVPVDVDESKVVIDKQGEKWYPYGTKFRIEYAKNMAELRGYYRFGNVISNSPKIDGWGYTTSSTYEINRTESYICEAYLYDNYAKDGERVRWKINIMPNPNSLQSNYCNYGVGNVYPVIVTGTTSGNLWGTDTYHRDSNINKAATHMGLVEVGKTKTVYIKIVPCPEGGYKASTRNGVESASNSNASVGFVFVDG